MSARSLRSTVLVVLALGLLAACGSSSSSSSSSTSSTTATRPTSSTTTSTTTSTPASSTTVLPGGPRPGRWRLYFVSGEKLAVAGASVGAVTPSQVMGQLLAGPTGLSAHQGMTTQIPAGTVLNRLQVSGDTATVDLSETFASGGGSLSMMLRAAEVTYTLTQFPGITKVDLLLDGAKVAGLGGEGLIATGWQRSTFEDVTPAVLVETPVPGAIVTSPLTGTVTVFVVSPAAKFSVPETGE